MNMPSKFDIRYNKVKYTETIHILAPLKLKKKKKQDRIHLLLLAKYV